ncbi:4Fe-4S ferredoxin [Fibrobacterota bacterium]
MSIERQSMQADIVCAGFGPATAGFLHRLLKSIVDENGQTVLESSVTPGMPLQVLCYERADDISFGVSGIVTRARAIRESLSEEELSQIPMSHRVGREETVYLLDHMGVSRRSTGVKIVDRLIRLFKEILPVSDYAFSFPFTPPFLNKHGGMVLSMGQFMQWVGSQLMSSGLVQIWPAMPAGSAIIEDGSIKGIRLVDQGTDKYGKPESGYMPGMDIYAAITVVGDGPVGSVGQSLNRHFGFPEGKHQRDWAVGMKAVVDLSPECSLEPGAVIHTLGFPEPEIFGFLYGLPEGKASLGIFVPSWFDNPVRNCYRYLQHWMMHPRLQRHLKGAVMRSWGAKSLQEDGVRGEPLLAGEGFARIGEGSGCTNILTNSGVDEAWKSGTLLAEGVVKLLKEKRPFTYDNLRQVYVEPRRHSWLGVEISKARGARDGFSRGFLRGMAGMALAGFSGGKLRLSGNIKRPHDGVPIIEKYFKDKMTPEEVAGIRKKAVSSGTNMYDAIMDRCGWPQIEYDGKLLVSHQDALLLGGKVQAPAGYADHVLFSNTELCRTCGVKRCVDMCSGQAITPGEDGVPLFDREKCIHCGACFWNCTKPCKQDPERSNIEFKAGTGGLHSAEN